MSRKPTKTQRLVRLNAFREERADDALRLALKDQSRVRDEHASAASAIERIGQWKSPGSPDVALDLTTYDQALELERVAMARADALGKQLAERERSTERARQEMSRAVSAARVSSRRGRQEAARSDAEQEKHVFDAVSDVWLNNRKPTHD